MVLIKRRGRFKNPRNESKWNECDFLFPFTLMDRDLFHIKEDLVNTAKKLRKRIATREDRGASNTKGLVEKNINQKLFSYLRER